MSDKVVICPDDGKVCEMKEDDKKGLTCWLCPKIQNLREDPYDRSQKEVSKFDGKQKE